MGCTVSAETDALETRRRDIATEITALHAEDRSVREQLVALQLLERPQYPTQVQRDGIVEAVRRIKAGVTPKSHHGDPTPTYEVTAGELHGYGWLTVRHGAPYGASGEKLWHFTDDEIESILELVRAEDIGVSDWWRANDCVSIRTTHKITK